jgi:GTP-binding protein
MNDQAAEAKESEELSTAAQKLFAGPCDFVWAAGDIDGLPPSDLPEIAFAGRSNVGKSSLLNALTNRKSLARTSNTPGRTQALNFFNLGEANAPARLRLVDMPGYGYAAVSKDKVSAWTKLMHAYLRGRGKLLRVFVLVDSRHGLKPQDLEMFDLLDRAAVSYQLVLTKTDAVKSTELASRLAETETALKQHPAAYPEILAVSSLKGGGLTELRTVVARLLKERGA